MSLLLYLRDSVYICMYTQVHDGVTGFSVFLSSLVSREVPGDPALQVWQPALHPASETVNGGGTCEHNRNPTPEQTTSTPFATIEPQYLPTAQTNRCAYSPNPTSNIRPVRLPLLRWWNLFNLTCWSPNIVPPPQENTTNPPPPHPPKTSLCSLLGLEVLECSPWRKKTPVVSSVLIYLWKCTYKG